MRILLSLLVLVFLGFFAVGLSTYIGGLGNPPVLTPKAYADGATKADHIKLQQAALDYTGMVWLENKHGHIHDAYIPIRLEPGAKEMHPKLWLHSKDSSDLELARQMRDLSPEQALPVLLSAHLERGSPRERDLHSDSAPSATGGSFSSSARFVRPAEKGDGRFPAYSFGFLLAAGFFLAANLPPPRALISSGNEKTLTVVGLTQDEVARLPELLAKGGRLVLYQWCLSIVVLTFKRPSEIYFLRPGENAVVCGLHCSFVTLFLGWWGFPWGPIYTIQSLWVNMTGGKDLTAAFITSPADLPPPLPGTV